MTEQSERLKFAGPPSNAEAGNFSFLLTPEIKDGGLYICDVYLNDKSFSQRTVLSVLKGRDEGQDEEKGCRSSIGGIKQGVGIDL